VTNPDLKGLANAIVQKIGQYKSDMAAALKSEQNKDYDGAIASYRAAQQVDQNGPGNPGTQIQRLEAVARAAQPPNPQPSSQKPSTPQTPVVAQKPPQQAKPAAEDPAVTFARLMDEAGKAEKTGNLQAAARAYDNATRVPGASDAAQAGKLRVQQAINSDPAEQAKTLTQALREFYASKFSDAEDDFGTYLSSPTAKSRGVAHFYLAASRLSRFIIEHPAAKNDATIDNPDVQRLFKEARSDKYVPVEKYVSPIVMRAWQSSN
jgi:hypothetical protein